MKTRQSRVHTKTFWGESDATPLLDWLNAKNRPEDDQVERLVLLNRELRDPAAAIRRYLASGVDTREMIRRHVAKTVRAWKFSLIPVVGNTPENGWTADWRHLACVPPAQALAFVKALHLANQQLLDRIRQCRECKKWFFARMIHKESCSKKCQQLYIRSSEDFKQKRRQEMRHLRQTKKLQEAKWVALSKAREGKGKK